MDVPEGGEHFQRYPDKGIEEWHKAEGCFYGSDEEDEPSHKKKQKTTRRKK